MACLCHLITAPLTFLVLLLEKNHIIWYTYFNYLKKQPQTKGKKNYERIFL